MSEPKPTPDGWNLLPTDTPTGAPAGETKDQARARALDESLGLAPWPPWVLHAVQVLREAARARGFTYAQENAIGDILNAAVVMGRRHQVDREKRAAELGLTEAVRELDEEFLRWPTVADYFGSAGIPTKASGWVGAKSPAEIEAMKLAGTEEDYGYEGRTLDAIFGPVTKGGPWRP